MGGKTGTTTSSVSIPPEVLARYNSVNAQAQTAAGTPFQQYSTDPNAFVAPLNAQQQQGVGNINQQAMAAQPGYQGAMAGTDQAYQGYNAPNYQQGVQAYMNPYLQNAMGSTAAMLQNQNQQQQQQLLGNTIQQGAFGGDRGNIAQAALMGQQNLAMGQTLGQMANQGYQQSAQNYMQGLAQQGALANQYGNLAGAAQTAGLQGAQAQLGAGTLGQQTETALYNQFQQQQAYPFQVAQFLANIAEGTGALSGSTTTQTSPTSFFSDRRLKHDIHRIGETDEGLPIYKFKYKGDDKTNIGFMADEVEKVHPEAVGESHGFKTVDYDRAARYAGGLVGNSEGGMVTPMHEKEGFFDGGDVASNPNDIAALLASQKQSYAPFQQGGLYGATSGGTPGGKGFVPAASLPVGHLAVASPSRTQAPETLMGDVHEASTLGKDAQDLWAQGQKFKKFASDYVNSSTAPQQGAYRGGLVHAYADGGDVEPYFENDPMSDVVKEGEKKPTELKLMQSQQLPSGSSGSNGMNDLNNAVSFGKDLAWIGSLFSKGGRAGFADGGDAEGFDPFAAEPGGIVGPSGAQAKQIPGFDLSAAEDHARNAGINPVEYTRLIKGESGGKPVLGDEGSSGGILQLHVGGLSKQYPNPGLGDAYVAERNPELAKSGTPQDKISYINDPANQNDISQWGANYIAKHGANAWTVARNQGLLGATSPADRPAPSAMNAQAATGQQGFAVPGEEQPKSLGDTLTSEKFLVPLLSGLGAMAGSNSRYLGAALLQGVGAGAKSYEDVQNQMLERQALQPVVQQRQIDTLNKLAGGLQAYNAQTGQNVSLQDYANMVGYKGYLPSGGQAAQSTNTGTSMPQALSLLQMQSAIVNRNGVQIPAMSDPLSLQAAIQKNGTSVDANVKNIVDNMRVRLNEIETHGYTTDVNGNRINLPGAIAAGQQGTFAEQQMEASKDFVNNKIKFTQIAPTIQKNLQDMEDIYSKFRAGADAPSRAAFSTLMGVVDPKNNIPELHNSDAADFQTAQKGASALITQQLANMPPGAPKAELEAIAAQIARPTAQPETVHHLLARAKAAVMYQQQMYQGYNPQKEGFDVPGYQEKFMSQIPFDEFADQVEKQSRPAAGSAPTGIVEGSTSTSKSGKPIVFRNGQWEYQ